jgi:DivIVA domain-containing protein
VSTRDYAQRVDRDAIERRDFPIGRRGYDQAAVDAHLRRVADELEALRPTAVSSLAAGTSEQVRVILEAAETSAADLRADAARRSGEHIARVERATGAMLTRLDEIERELGTLLDALRTNGERLTDDLARLREQAATLGAAGEPPEEDFAAAAPEPSGCAPAESSRTAAAPEPPAGVPSESSRAAAAPEPSAGAPAESSARPSPNGDEAGARLIALNMALSGSPREETARYLAEHFQLPDAEALLEDVYERAGR